VVVHIHVEEEVLEEVDIVGFLVVMGVFHD